MQKMLWIGLAAIIGVAAIAAVTGLGSSQPDQTYGTIFVSGPQVFTRERLVNDRYREDAWLQAELDSSKNLTFGVTGQDRTLSTVANSASVAVGAGNAPQSPSEKPPSPQEPPPLSPAQAQLFNQRLSFRERVRDLQIENQLDDRHDLRGNSLYRLKFDAAVITGINTRRSAMVSVSLLPPEHLFSNDVDNSPTNDALSAEERKLSQLRSLGDLGPRQREAWNRIYARWLDSLNKRFDTARNGLMRAYDDGKFELDDYTTLLASMRRELLSKGNILVGSQAHPPPSADLQALAKITNDPAAFRQSDLESLNKLRAVGDDQSDVSRERVQTLVALGTKIQTTTLQQAAALFPDVTVGQPLQAPQQRTLSVGIPIIGQLTVQRQGAEISPAQTRCTQMLAYDRLNREPTPKFQGDPTFSLPSALDKAFENHIYNAVLGIEFGPAFNPLDQDLPGNRPNPNLLDRLVRRVTTYGAEAHSFAFGRQLRYLIVARTPRCDLRGFLPWTTRDRQRLYILGTSLEAVKDLLEDYDPEPDLDQASADLDKVDETDPKNTDSNFVAVSVDVGLIKFIRNAGRRLDVFSYALKTPEQSDLIALNTAESRSTTLGAAAGGTVSGVTAAGSTGRTTGRQTARNRVEDRPAVLVFGQQLSSAIPSFGWIIHPPQAEPEDVQRPSISSLTALISLPAWWEEVRVKVTTSWTDQSNPEYDRKISNYRVELPVNFETIDSSLFDNNDRSPALSLWTNETQAVEVCRPAELIVRGTRLWRSTVVTLGAQRADEIFVLPDMKGVIARFNQVDPPSELRNGMYTTLNVWTSQGSISPPKLVQVKAPDARCPSRWSPRPGPPTSLPTSGAGSSPPNAPAAPTSH